MIILEGYDSLIRECVFLSYQNNHSAMIYLLFAMCQGALQVKVIENKAKQRKFLPTSSLNIKFCCWW